MSEKREHDFEPVGSTRPDDHLQTDGGDTAVGPGPTEILRDPSWTEELEREPSTSSGVGQCIGPYLLEAELGRGGQGVVYQARDIRLGRTVALKLMEGQGAFADQRLTRFRREAEAASRLDHPGICGVYEAGVADGHAFIAMRFVTGETLAARIARMKRRERPEPLQWRVQLSSTEEPGARDGHAGRVVEDRSPPTSSVDRAGIVALLGIFGKAAVALHAAHEAGVLHRDIKPGNIMIDKDGQPVLLDFGLAHVEDNEGESLTRTGDVFGTPAYMSPEQVSGLRHQLDRRSDVYSLGVSLYESLVLRRPFEAPTRQVLYQAILSEEPQDPRRLNPLISRDLKVVLETALAKERDGRYQTALDFARDLEALGEGRPIAARPVGFAGRIWRWAKRHPAAAVLVLTVALGAPLVTGLAGFIWASLPSLERTRQMEAFEQVEHSLERGFYEMHHASSDAAVEHFEKVIETDPASGEGYAGLALAHMFLSNHAAAMEVLEKGERMIEEPRVLAPLKSDVLRLTNKKEEYEAYRDLEPENPGPLFWFIEGVRASYRGHALGETSAGGRVAFARAEQLLSRAVAASPRARRAYHFQLAHVHGHRSNVPRRDEVATAIAALWPESASGWFWIGFSMESSDKQRAMDAYLTAIDMDPEHGTARANLARLLAESGDSEGAIQQYREAIRILPNSLSFHISLSDVLRAAKRYEEAETICKSAIAIDPAAPDPRITLGNVLFDLNRREESIGAFRSAIDCDSARAAAHYGLGRVLYEEGRVEEALVASKEAIRLDDSMAEAHRIKALCLKARGQFEESEAATRDAIRANPRYVFAYNDLGLVLMKLDRVDDAIASYRKALEIDPQLATAHLNLGIALERKGDRENAISCYRNALQYAPGLIQARSRLADAHLAAGRVDDALEEYRKCLEQAPEDAAIRTSYALAIERSEGIVAALDQYARAKELSPSNARMRTNYGIALAAASRRTESAAEFREAIRLDPGHKDAHYCLGAVLLQMGELDVSIEHFRQAVRIDPGNSQFQKGLETALSGRGAPADLVALYRARLARDANDTRSLNGLAWVLVDPDGDPALRNPEEALPLAARAVDLSHRNDPSVLDTFAVALFANGRLEEAVSVQEELLRLMDGKDSGVLKIQDAQAALEVYRSALSRKNGR